MCALVYSLNDNPLKHADLDNGCRVMRPAFLGPEVVRAHDQIVDCRLHTRPLVELHLQFVELIRQFGSGASDWNLPPFAISNTPAASVPAINSFAAVVTSDSTSSTRRGGAAARASAAIRTARSWLRGSFIVEEFPVSPRSTPLQTNQPEFATFVTWRRGQCC